MQRNRTISKLLLFSLAFTALILILYWVFDWQQEPLRLNRQAREQAPGRFIQLPAGLTHYQLDGPEDGDLLVLIHGGMVSGMFAYEPNYHHFIEKGYRVLRYDLYGRGYSDRLEQEYTPALFFNQFEQLLDSLNLHEPFYLCGLSMGSMVALDYSQKHPEQVKKLVLLSPAVRGKFRLHPVLQVPGVSNLVLTAWWRPRAIRRQMEEFYEGDRFPEYKNKLEEMARYRGYKQSNLSTWKHTLTYNMEPQIKAIGDSGIPVALILGEHDPYVPAEEAAIYREKIPTLVYFQIEKAGHVVNYERPDTVNQILHSFFQQ